MTELSTPAGSSPVPAFLLKLWTLLEDPSNSDVITWNWNGQNFCILDDQRFSKEILPKYFKHNNLSSFIRQLNMYGFRKVMSLESGISKLEHGSPIEFQHPFFKKGKAELLENIKRKMSSGKSEEPHLSQEELQKVVFELQALKNVQSNMDTKFENMRRENQALWKEVSLLRRRHNQQQKLLTKLFQFILTLTRGKVVMAPKRKRQLTLEPTQSPLPKYSRHVLQFPEDIEEEVHSSQNVGCSRDNSSQIHEVFILPDAASELSTQPEEQIQSTVLPAIVSENLDNEDPIKEIVSDDSVLRLHSLTDQSLIMSSSAAEEPLALDVLPTNSSEDPGNVISDILNENYPNSNNELLDREELQDVLCCIDASLEELQSMLSRKKLNTDSDFMDEELQDSEERVALQSSNDQLNKGKQLMQYTGNPLISLFEEPSTNNGIVTTDPTDLLNTIEDNVYPETSEVQNNSVLGNSSKEPDLLVDDFSVSQDLLPIFVLSPVNKLIDEVIEEEKF